MTEQKWLEADSPERKRRLLACAFARQVWPLLADARSRQAVEVAERFADGKAHDEELAAAVEDATQARDEVRINRRAGDRLAARFDIRATAEECAVVGLRASLYLTVADAERVQAALVGDIFGNPFCPSVVEPSWLSWNDGAVVALALTISAERRFDDTPVLADALEEAGADSGLIDHLRGSNPHVSGCHGLDAVLSKE